LRDFPADLFLKRGSQPGRILLYFEDLNRAPNAEFGPISLHSTSFARQEDFIEMGSNSARHSNKHTPGGLSSAGPRPAAKRRKRGRPDRDNIPLKPPWAPHHYKIKNPGPGDQALVCPFKGLANKALNDNGAGFRLIGYRHLGCRKTLAPLCGYKVR
jgi:hypothetical protein